MKSRPTTSEIVFQVALNAIVFLFYAYDRRGDSFMNYHYVFFINYAIAALVINYVALPLYYRNRKIWILILFVIGVLFASIFIEEMFLEQIFFPNRGDSFRPWWAFLEIIPLLTILAGGKFAWDAITKQREVEMLKDAVRQSELQFLKSQINPHFLFNNLNNLYSYALEGASKTPDIILELSGVLRYMLYECRDEFVPLSKEVKHLAHYIGLNELQIEERGSVRFESSGDFENYEIAPLILIVFVENAFKHSLASLAQDIDIVIKVAVDKVGLLTFECSNHFQELANNDNVATGIGLKNVKKRLELIYGGKYDLTIADKDDYYVVKLKMELNKV